MAIEEALYAILTGDGALGGVKIYPDQTPELGALPAVAYFRVSSPRIYSQSGPTLAHPRFQFDCKANDATTARTTATDVYDVLSGWAGVSQGVTIEGIFEKDSRGPTYDRDTKIWVVQKDFEVFYVE